MPAVQKCSECGAEIANDEQNGLCMRCLLTLGLQAAAVSSPANAPAAIGPPFATRQSPCVTAFGDYELLEEIARGGMGIVFKARQVSLDRIVAVKLLLAGALSSPEYVKRFRVEASAAASLKHPNIVTIHEVGVHQGHHYLVMDFVDGPSLAKLAAQQPVPAKRAAAYVKTIAEAVHYAHEHGILHRDLKPSNVLLDSNDQPRVTDFGLAKRFEGESEVTLSGPLVGSPSYMPPEQAAAKCGKVSRRSDVYGLGASLYHLLTGRAPYQAATLTATLDQVLNAEPIAPRLLNPTVPRDLETVCLKCLEKEPAKRYPTAEMLAEDLDRFLAGKPVLARPIGPAGKAWRWWQRNPRLAFATAAAVLSLLTGLAGVTWQWRKAESHRARAEAEALVNRRSVYASDMKEVQRKLEEGDRHGASALLDQYQPGAIGKRGMQNAKSDLRGWEWRYFWALCQSGEQFRLHQYSTVVSALTFSADGKWLAVRQADGAVAIWDAATKRTVTNLPGAGLPKALAFSPTASLLAWGDEDASGAPAVGLLDLSAEKKSARFPHSQPIGSIAFSPDAKQLAVLGSDGAVRVWDLYSRQVAADIRTASGDSLRDLSSASTNATASAPLLPYARESSGRVVFSPDGRWLVVGETQPRILLLERATGERKEIEVPRPAAGITALAFSPDSKLLAAGCGYGDRAVHVWDLVADTNATLAGHRGCITGLAFSPDGQTLASVSTDWTLRFWDVARRCEQRRFKEETDELRALAWSPDGENLVTGSGDGTVRYWGSTAKPSAAYDVLPTPICSWGLVFVPDCKTFLTVTWPEGAVVSWDATSLQRLESFPFLGTNHCTLDLSKDGRWLALGDPTGNIQVWDFLARRLATNLVFPQVRLIAVAFSPRGGYLHAGAVGAGGVATRIWAAPGWRELSLQDIDLKNIREVDFSPDDRTLAVGYDGGTAAWWDLATRERKDVFDCQGGRRVRPRFSLDERRFATGGMNGVLTLWDVATRQPTSIGRKGELQDLAFSPDSRRLITTGPSPRELVKLWDVETGREVAALPGEPGFFHHLGCSPDGNTLFAVNMDHIALLWRAPSWEQIEQNEQDPSTP